MSKIEDMVTVPTKDEMVWVDKAKVLRPLTSVARLWLWAFFSQDENGDTPFYGNPLKEERSVFALLRG